MTRKPACGFIAVLYLMLLAGQAGAQTLAGDALVAALKSGGFVLVMRHANSPRDVPEAAAANPDNVNGERQLDEKGRLDAIALGEALRRLEIPLAEVASSPTYRALETARLAGFTDVVVHEQLSNEGMSTSSAEYAAWLRQQVVAAPASGNRLLITHGPNISAAFPDDAGGMEEGEALVIDTESVNGAVLAARIKITDWPSL